MKCPKCGRLLKKRDKFCDRCGIPVLAPPIEIERLEEEDWRGLLALTFTASFIAICGISIWPLKDMELLKIIASIFGPMEGLILGFYFGGKTT